MYLFHENKVLMVKILAGLQSVYHCYVTHCLMYVGGVNIVSLCRALSESYSLIWRFFILDTDISNKWDFPFYWKLPEGYLARSVILVIVCGVFIVEDTSLYWTEGYLVYTTFGHSIMDIWHVGPFVILDTV
jgi:hypothetical protein